MCWIDYDLLFPADLLLKDNDVIAFEGQVIHIEEDTIYKSGSTIHTKTIAYYKILNLYKGELDSDTIPVYFYNHGMTCDPGGPTLNEKALIVEAKDEATNRLAIGYCSFFNEYWKDEELISRAAKKGIPIEAYLKYLNTGYFEKKSLLEQLTAPKKDGELKIYAQYKGKPQLVVEGQVINGQLKGIVKVYDKDGELAFEIEK